MLKERYVSFLKKQPHSPVSRETLLDKAIGVGYGEKKAKEVLYDLRDDEMLVEVGSWYGTRTSRMFQDPEEERTLWFCYYKVEPKQVKRMQEAIDWFNRL